MTTKSDLTGFAALLGESFSSRIDLLSQILKDSHYPSLGNYKERILAETIKKYLPSPFEVGTGFVLFPHEHVDPPGGLENFDKLNKSAFTTSKQCDIIVFDSTYPTVFRDGDFIVLRPEAVKAIIEVKGAISLTETRNVISSFIDFGKKWRTTQLFYKSHHQQLSDYPSLICMAWDIAKKNGKPAITAERIRREICDQYSKKTSENELDGFPLLKNLYIYNEAEISLTYGSPQDGMHGFNLGWGGFDGKFNRLDPTGVNRRGNDRTISSLLAVLHITTDQSRFNRFFSYTDENRNHTSNNYPNFGFSWCWTDIHETKEKPFNSDKIHS